jgi:hypothetical protein
MYTYCYILIFHLFLIQILSHVAMLSFQLLVSDSCIILSNKYISLLEHFLISGYLDNFQLFTSINLKRLKEGENALLSFSFYILCHSPFPHTHHSLLNYSTCDPFGKKRNWISLLFICKRTLLNNS